MSLPPWFHFTRRIQRTAAPTQHETLEEGRFPQPFCFIFCPGNHSQLQLVPTESGIQLFPSRPPLNETREGGTCGPPWFDFTRRIQPTAATIQIKPGNKEDLLHPLDSFGPRDNLQLQLHPNAS